MDLLNEFSDKESFELWKIFLQISKIPRSSGNEGRIADFIEAFVKKKGFSVKRDSVNNLIIRAESDKSDLWLGLQAHMDMVCVKEANSKHNFSKDPLKLFIDGDFLKAKETTLGADNGIGVALALSLLDLKERPNLEILFTVEEESSMRGVFSLDDKSLKSKMMINLDSEDEGVFTIGCAGGLDIVAEKRLSFLKNSNNKTYELTISGLPGGHSGVNIYDSFRYNAITLLSLCLLNIKDIQLISFEGGDARNSIPKDAKAVFSTNKSIDEIKAIFKSLEKSFSLKVEIKESKSETAISKKDSFILLKALLAVPSHVLEMSSSVKGLVQSSNNLGRVYFKDNKIVLENLFRTSNKNAEKIFPEKIKAILELAGFEVFLKGYYPGWDPNINSPLLKKAKDVYKKVFSKEAKIEAIHAGLECGIIKSKYPDIDLISLGPDIKGAHTTKEKVSISSVERTYIFLRELLKQMR